MKIMFVRYLELGMLNYYLSEAHREAFLRVRDRGQVQADETSLDNMQPLF